MKQQFHHLSSQLRPDLDIRFFSKPPPPPLVQKFFRNKDPMAKRMQSNVVYSVQCSDCDQVYIRKTTLLCEHGAPSSMFNPSTTVTSNAPTLHLDTDKDQSKSSALASHTQETGHHINWSDFRIVWQDENPYGLLMKESLLIQAFQPELNRTTNSVPLILFPDSLPRQMLPNPHG